MSPLSDWRLPFSGFSSLSLQNKERPFQKSGFHLPGGKLPSGWEGKQQEGGVRDTRERNSEDDLTWESCPGAPPHTWTSPHRILSLFQQFFLVNRQLSVPIYLVFFSLFASGRQNRQKGKGTEKGTLERISGVCSAIRADVQCSAPHRERHFSFYRTVDNVQGVFI